MLLADPQFGILAFTRARQQTNEAAQEGRELDSSELTGQDWNTERDRVSRAVQIANSVQPDFVAVLGDLVMDWDNQQQVEEVKAEFARIDSGIPVYWVVGNHDVGIDFRTPAAESLEAYRKSFGADYYTFVSGISQFIVFNSPLFDKPDAVPQETANQKTWLEAELSKPLPTGVRHRIVLSHHPLFETDIEEEYGTYNLPVEQRRYLAELFLDAGVSHMFAGHTHSNGGTVHQGLRIVTTTSIGAAKAGRRGGYRLVTATPDAIHHSFYELS